MMLQSLNNLENSIGGRPKQAKSMSRLTFYLPEQEAEKLKSVASQRGQSISVLVRQLVWPLLGENRSGNSREIDSQNRL